MILFTVKTKDYKNAVHGRMEELRVDREKLNEHYTGYASTMGDTAATWDDMAIAEELSGLKKIMDMLSVYQEEKLQVSSDKFKIVADHLKTIA